MSEKKLHPMIKDLQNQLEQGKINRRTFLRYATLLGASVATAQVLAACGATPEPTAKPAEPTAVPPTAVPPTAVPPTEIPPTAVPEPVSGIKRGGTMRVAQRVPRIDHPARYSWMEPANISRQVNEYLTLTQADGVTIPWLLESWEANDTLDEWTLHLKEGIKFNDGSDFTADDVVWNFMQWLDPDVGSALLGQFSYLSPEGVEKVDDHTVKLSLNTPNVAVPEHLYHYAAQILPEGFGGDWTKEPVGTGPFVLDEYIETERAVLKARDDYWGMGEDGQPLPYLDEIIYIDLGQEQSAWLSALQADQVDKIFNVLPEQLESLRAMDHVTIQDGPTGATYVIRMRADMEPWDDNRVRQALKMAQDRQVLLDLGHFGEGSLATDAHVSPAHPEYCDKPIPEYDPEGAKALLVEAGYPDGLDITMTAMSNTPEGAIATAFKEMAAPAGFDVTVDLVPASQYWEVWTDIPLGVTTWAHRTPGVMTLPLAYIGDENGDPVPWNETRWVDEEFSTLLTEAEGTLDIEARREIMCKIMDIQIERGSVGIPFWRNQAHAFNNRVQDHVWDPNSIDNFHAVWFDPDA